MRGLCERHFEAIKEHYDIAVMQNSDDMYVLTATRRSLSVGQPFWFSDDVFASVDEAMQCSDLYGPAGPIV